jgi:hypothetical protein
MIYETSSNLPFVRDAQLVLKFAQPPAEVLHRRGLPPNETACIVVLVNQHLFEELAR